MMTRFSDRLEKYAFRSVRQILLHLPASAVLAAIVGLFLGCTITVSASHFVAIVSSMSAASGALLAITIAVATFYSRHETDSRDKLIEKLAQERARTRHQMEKSAPPHPEISRHLAPLYEKSVGYTPGQPIDMEEIGKAADLFTDWARNQAENRSREIDPGKPEEYVSFELHLRDATLCISELEYTFRLLMLASIGIRGICNFSYLIAAWAIILILTMTFAITGAIEVIPAVLSFPVLASPFWLFLVAIFALIKDIEAVLSGLQVHEVAHYKARQRLASDLPSKT